MGYDVSSIIVYGVPIISSFQEKKNIWKEVERVVRLLFPEMKITEDFFADEFYELKLKNGNKTYRPMVFEHGNQEKAFFLVLHSEETQICRGTDEWPRKLQPPSEVEVVEFIRFLEAKGIANARADYGQYQCLAGGS